MSLVYYFLEHGVVFSLDNVAERQSWTAVCSVWSWSSRDRQCMRWCRKTIDSVMSSDLTLLIHIFARAIKKSLKSFVADVA